jgi:hypothetical protein
MSALAAFGILHQPKRGLNFTVNALLPLEFVTFTVKTWRLLAMPDRQTVERTREDEREGKAPSTQAGEFVREEIHHVREGKHGVRSAKQAIAIGLSKARRAGVKLSPPKGPTSVRKKAEQDTVASESPRHKTSAKRSRAVTGALRRESLRGASTKALSSQAKKSAIKRGKQDRRRAAIKASRTRRAA